MKYYLSISGVGGDFGFICESTDLSMINRFLLDHDHEGSGLTLTIRVEDERVYDVLNALGDLVSETK